MKKYTHLYLEVETANLMTDDIIDLEKYHSFQVN